MNDTPEAQIEVQYERLLDDVEIERTTLRARVEELEGALEFCRGAIRYVRLPHHLNAEEECSPCHVATGVLDAALEQLDAALDEKESK